MTVLGWCPECQRSRVVVDKSIESAHTGPHTETDFHVTTFECGHDTSSIKGKRYLP